MPSCSAEVILQKLLGEIAGRCPGSIMQKRKNAGVAPAELATALSIASVVQPIEE